MKKFYLGCLAPGVAIVLVLGWVWAYWDPFAPRVEQDNLSVRQGSSQPGGHVHQSGGLSGGK